MAYLPNIPQANDQLRISQGDILGNFGAINSYVGVNHVPFNTGVDDGKHNVVTMTEQTALPAFLPTETAIYNTVDLITNINQTFVHTKTLAGSADIPFTASFLGTHAPLNDADGWTYLPSGILIKWTYLSGPGGLNSFNVPFGANNGPAFTNIFAVSLTIRDIINPATDTDRAVRLVDISGPNSFRVYFSYRATTGPAAGTAKAIIIGV